MNNSEDSVDSIFPEEESSYTFRQIFDMLLTKNDIIVTVPTTQVSDLKAGLITRKSKDNRKSVRTGLLPIDEVLNFTVYPALDETTKQPIPGLTCVRIKLIKKKGVNILSIEAPDESF